MSENSKNLNKKKKSDSLISEVKQSVKKELSVKIPKSSVVFKKENYYNDKPKLTHVEYTIKI